MNSQENENLLELAVSVQRQPGVYALLLGSGISRDAGIQTGWEITLELIKGLAGESAKNWQEQEIVSWYKQQYGEDPNYSKVVERIAPQPSERRGILESYFEPNEAESERNLKVPTLAHKAIAKLVRKGYIRMILTTNFDRLMEQALAAEGIQPVVIASPAAIEGAPPYVHERVIIVKLHGDYKDIGIKNSPKELAAYDQPLDIYLDRVLDEFGLIVAGWSAEYDTALRAAILRMKSRRYSMYWLAQRNPRQAAQELISFRKGRVVQGLDANSFFDSLSIKVEALEEARWNPPQSVLTLVAEVKRYLSDPKRFHIKLEDLVQQEAQGLAEVMQADLSQCPWLINDASQCQPCLEFLEVKSERLVRILAAITRYDRQDNFVELIARAFDILAYEYTPIGDPFNDAEKYIRLYPLVLAMYSVFIVGSQQGKAELLRSVLDIPWKWRKRYDRDMPLIQVILYVSGYSNSIFNTVLGQNSWLSLPNRVKEVLMPWLTSFLVDIDSGFYKGEFLLQLASVEVEKQASLPALHLYESKAKHLLLQFLSQQPTWLRQLYPDIENVLQTFDTTAQARSRGSFGGFDSGAIAAFCGNQASK